MEQATFSQTGVEIPYAAPAATHGHRVLAGAAILLGGIALAVVGGCFLIGVMLITSHGFNTSASSVPLNTSALALMGVLYVLAFATFACAGLIILAGLRGLFRVLRGH
jgi:hypothetical protein